jgi:cytochrome c
MKKVFVVLCVSAVLAACGGSSKSGSTDSTTTAGSADSTASASTAATSSAPGAKLIAANDCSTCHKVDTKVIGPAFQDVANKYPATDANIDTLANKVIKGGKGNWGDIPMAAHPTLALADAKEMVKYILSLKK